MNNQRDFHLISSNDTAARPSYDFNKMKIDGTVYKNDVISSILTVIRRNICMIIKKFM